jgi:hypothetical protein
MVAENSQLHHYHCGTHLLGGFGGIVCCSGGHIIIYCLSCVRRIRVVCMYYRLCLWFVRGVSHPQARSTQRGRETRQPTSTHHVLPLDATPPPSSAPTRCHDPCLLHKSFPNLVSDAVNHNGEVQLSYFRGVAAPRLQTRTQSENRNHPPTAPHGRARAGDWIAHLP